MRFKLIFPAVLVALLAACSTGGPGASDANPSDAATPGGNGEVDCAAIDLAGQQLLGVQFLAQLRTPDTVEQIRDQQIGSLDLNDFLAAMQVLHALDSYASPLGDPKAAIEVYERAGEAAQVLFATDPITQAAIDSYNNEFVGTIGEFLGHQAAISGAVGEAGC